MISRVAAAVAAVVAIGCGAGGCDRSAAGVDARSPRSLEQAVGGAVTFIALGPATQSIAEGGGAVVDVALLCASSNVGASVLVSWGDGAADDVVTIAPPAVPVQGACPAGEFAQCDQSSGGSGAGFDAACDGIGHAYADDGDFAVSAFDDVPSTAPVNVTVSDASPAIAIDSVSLTNGAREPAVPSVGVTFSAGSDADTVARIEVDWGDGLAPETFAGAGVAGVGVAGNTRTLTRGAGAYGPAGGSGTFALAVTVFDEDSSGGPAGAGAVIVENVAPLVTDLFVTPVPVVEGSALTAVALVENTAGASVDGLRFSFAFECDASDGADDADFGEARPGTSASAIASHVYPDDGARVACVRVCDDDAGADSCSFGTANVSVVNAAPALRSFTASAPRVNEGSSLTLTASAIDAGAAGGGGADDVLTFDFDCDDDGAVDGSVVGSPAQFVCTYPASGSAQARVTVSDGDGGAATATLALAIDNVPPVLAPVTSPPEDLALVEGDTLSVDIGALASDAGAGAGGGDVLTFTLVQPPSPPAAQLDPASGALTWDTTFADIGQHDFVVRVTDSDGAASETSFAVDVVLLDDNGNAVSDGLERSLNGGALFDPAFATTDSDEDGVFDLDELVSGTDPDVSDAPTAPAPLAPIDDARVASLAPELTVTNATSPRGRALTYTFVVVGDGDGVELAQEAVLPGSAVTSARLDGTGSFIEGARYEWFAVANDGIVDGPASARGSFVIDLEANVAPRAPVPIAPVDGDVVGAAGDALTLEIAASSDDNAADTLTYEFELARDALFASAPLERSGLQSALTVDVDASLLDDDARYFWRARAFDGALYSDWSNATFAVDLENDAPAVPFLLSPADGAIVDVAPRTFLVGNVNDADPGAGPLTIKLDVDVGIVASATLDVAPDATAVHALEVGTLPFEPGARTFWTVTVDDGNGGLSSASSSFTILEPAPDVFVAAGGGGLCAQSRASTSSCALLGALLALLWCGGRRRRR